MSQSEHITPPKVTSNSKTGYATVANSSAEARLLELFKGDRAALNQLIEKSWRLGQSFDPSMVPLPSSSKRSLNRTSTKSAKNTRRIRTCVPSNEFENFEACIRQRAEQLILMSNMSHGTMDPRKNSAGDALLSKKDEETLKSFLEFFGQRVGIVCSECYDALDLNGKHSCTPSKLSTLQKKEKGFYDIPNTAYSMLDCTCLLDDDGLCMADLGPEHEGFKEAIEHSVPLPLDWAALRDQVLTTKADQQNESVKKKKQASSSGQDKSRKTFTSKNSSAKSHAVCEVPGRSISKDMLENEVSDSTLSDDDKNELLGHTCLGSQGHHAKTDHAQSGATKEDVTRAINDGKKYQQLLERQKEAKQKREEHKKQMKERKKTERLQEELQEQEKLEQQEAQRQKAIHEEEKMLSDKAKEEARRRSFMDKADQVFRSYLFDRAQKCDIAMVEYLLNTQPQPPDQEQVQHPPVPATIAAKNLDVWEHYERNRDDSSMISVGSGIPETLLHVAVKAGSFQLTKFLLLCGASLVAVDSAGRTPLHTATECATTQSIGIVKLLIQHGPIRYIDTQTMQSQDTCLHIAAAARNRPLVEYLLEMHAKTHFVNADGHTAEKVARLQLKQVESDENTDGKDDGQGSKQRIDNCRKIIAYFIKARILMQENIAQKERLEIEKKQEEATKIELEKQQDDKIRRKQEEKLLKEAKKREEEEELLKSLVKPTAIGKKKKKSKSKSKVTAAASGELHPGDKHVDERTASSKAHTHSVDSTSEWTSGAPALSNRTDNENNTKNSVQSVCLQPNLFVNHSCEEFIDIQQRIMPTETRTEQHQVRFPVSNPSVLDQSIPILTQPIIAMDTPTMVSCSQYFQPTMLSQQDTQRMVLPSTQKQHQQPMVELAQALAHAGPIHFGDDVLAQQQYPNSNLAYIQHQANSNMDSKVICPPRNNAFGYTKGSAIQPNGSLLGWNAFSPEIWRPSHSHNGADIAFAQSALQQRQPFPSDSPDVHQNFPRFSLFG